MPSLVTSSLQVFDSLKSVCASASILATKSRVFFASAFLRATAHIRFMRFMRRIPPSFSGRGLRTIRRPILRISVPLAAATLALGGHPQAALACHMSLD
jgi:hypothetical protein